MKRAILFLSLLSIVACGSPPDSSDESETIQQALGTPTVIHSPFSPGNPVEVFVGNDNARNNIVFYKARSTGFCWSAILSTASDVYLKNDVQIFGSLGDDLMNIVGDPIDLACSNLGATVRLARPIQGTKTLKLFGSDGNDVINCTTGLGLSQDGFPGDSYNVCYGGKGSDLMFNYGPNCGLAGNEDNDVLWSSGGAHSTVSGDDGDDCITYSGVKPAYYDGGNGSFDRSTHVLGTHVEFLATDCLGL